VCSSDLYTLFPWLTVLDNVRTAHYAQANYSLAEALLQVGRYRREEERISRHAMDLLAAFKLDGLADELSKNLPYGSQRRLEIASILAKGLVRLRRSSPVKRQIPATERKVLLGFSGDQSVHTDLINK
jgi:branched-chain amino acid transport system ATP-binding protein